MALIPPPKNWWKIPLGKDEKVWAYVIILMIVMMGTITVVWVFLGNQNPPELYTKYNSYDDYKNKAWSSGSTLDLGTLKSKDVPALIADDSDTEIFLSARQFAWSIIAPVTNEGNIIFDKETVQNYPINGKTYPYLTDVGLQVKANTYYRLHVYGVDRLHGFEISERVVAIQIVPQYDYVFEFMATQPGLYQIICNEYCGTGHHTMTLWLEVVE